MHTVRYLEHKYRIIFPFAGEIERERINKSGFSRRKVSESGRENERDFPSVAWNIVS